MLTTAKIVRNPCQEFIEKLSAIMLHSHFSQSRCSLLISILLFVNHVSASPLMPFIRADPELLFPLAANASNPGTNLSGIGPPPQLHIQTQPLSGKPLPDIPSVYFLTLNLANRFCMYPFDGKETQAIRHAIRETPGYFISIRGHLPNGGFEINLMFWGLQFAAHWIAQSRQPSYERQFTVLWENRFIGTIKYWYSAPPSSLGFPDISSPAALSDDFEWNNTISAEPTSNGIVKFDKFHPVRGPVPLDLSSITMTLLAGFITSAAEGIDTPIFSAKYQTGDSRYRPRIQLVTNFGAKPPEWFKFDVVRMMLVRLVILYFEQLKGKEGQRSGYAFDMLYDGRLAGKGVLGIPPGGAFAIEDGTDSVATS